MHQSYGSLHQLIILGPVMTFKLGHFPWVRKLLDDVCLRYRPHLEGTWQRIYNIPIVDETHPETFTSLVEGILGGKQVDAELLQKLLGIIPETFVDVDGEEKGVGSAILLSSHENEDVTLVEQLVVAKEWKSDHQGKSNSETSKIIMTCVWLLTFDHRRLVGSVVKFIKENPNTLFAGILRFFLNEGETHMVLKQAGDSLRHFGRSNPLSVGFTGRRTSLMCFLELGLSHDLLEQLIKNVRDRQKLLNAHDELSLTVVHHCVLRRDQKILRILKKFSADFKMKVNIQRISDMRCNLF